MGNEKQGIILSISLLTGGNNPYLRNCLESLKEIRTDIPSELIIVDTGCEQVDRNLIESYADDIVDFSWCEDFAAARNAGLEKCSGEWFLYLDDDEVFMDTKAIVHFFASGEYKNYGMAGYVIRNLYDETSENYRDFVALRLFRRSMDTHFEFAIHENIMPQIGESKNINAVAYHYGYLSADIEKLAGKRQRNMKILQAELAKNPMEMHYANHLVNEYSAAGQFREQAEFCEKYLHRTLDSKNEEVRIYRGIFYAGLMDAYLKDGKENRIMPLVNKAIQDAYCSDLLKTYFYGCACIASAAMGRPEDAKFYGTIYQNFYRALAGYESLYSQLVIAGVAYTEEFYQRVICCMKENICDTSEE